MYVAVVLRANQPWWLRNERNHFISCLYVCGCVQQMSLLDLQQLNPTAYNAVVSSSVDACPISGCVTAGPWIRWAVSLWDDEWICATQKLFLADPEFQELTWAMHNVLEKLNENCVHVIVRTSKQSSGLTELYAISVFVTRCGGVKCRRPFFR